MPNFEGIVTVSGARLFVVRSGRGPVLFVIHGGPDWDHTYLRSFMDPLKASINLIFFDLRGCGRSETYTDPSALHVGHVVEDLRNLMLHFRIDSAALLGFSFGGRIGLEFINRYPALVSRFILASSSAYASKPAMPVGPAQGIETPEEVRAWAIKSLEQEISGEALERARKAIAEVRFSNQWLGALRSGRSISYPERDYSKSLMESALPTLILHGELDRTFPVSYAERLAREVPHAELAVIRGASHFAQIDATDEWNATIIQFLRHE